MQQIRMTILFFHWFFKFMKSLKRIATLTIKEAIKNSPHNLNKKNLIKKIQIKKSQMKQNLIKFCFFFFTLGEVREIQKNRESRNNE